MEILSLVCINQCGGLCGIDPEKNEKKYFLEAIQNLTVYYGLNQQELKLSLDDPKAAFFVYQAKNLAEKMALNLCKRNDRNDESDGVRYVAWAIYSCLYIGPEKASKFLSTRNE